MTEVWKPVLGYEGVYEVSDQGRVKRLAGTSHLNPAHDNILTPIRHDRGYVNIKLSVKSAYTTHFAHRLVLEAFRGPCPAGKQGHHCNGVRDDNRLCNLEWISRGENMHQANMVRGEAHPLTTLAEDDVRFIRKHYKRGTSGKFNQAGLAQRFGASPATIRNVIRRRTWKHVE